MKIKPVIGRMAIVMDLKHGGRIHTASVLDAVAGTNRAKRVRLQTGVHQGEVLMPGQYRLLEFA